MENTVGETNNMKMYVRRICCQIRERFEILMPISVRFVLLLELMPYSLVTGISEELAASNFRYGRDEDGRTFLKISVTI
jgi:hypothetical protein